MLWIKAFHIVFIASWFAGLFYLPRIFVNLAEAKDTATTQRLLLMARRLYRFMNVLSVPAVILGLTLWMHYGLGRGQGWMHLKLLMVLLLLIDQHICGHLLKAFEAGRNTRSSTWYRWFNEMPVLVLIVIAILVVVKPF